MVDGTTFLYCEAVGACDGERYYLSLQQDAGRQLLVYDLRRGLWLREDDAPVVDMVCRRGQVLLLREDGLWQTDRDGARDLPWSATFCPFHETVDGRKGYSRFFLRAEMARDARLTVEMQTDADPNWRQVGAVLAAKDGPRTVNIPIHPTRCDSLTLRLQGQGDVTVKTLVREFSVLSEI